MAPSLRVSFVAGRCGPWRIDRIEAVVGESLPMAERLAICEAPAEPIAVDLRWVLQGTTSNLRYTHRTEVAALASRHAPLRRPHACLAALIPIRKTEAWWDLAQDERRAIFEEQSRHITIGLDYLPAVARRLHHSRELGQPFDFLTWFEYAREDAEAFEHMVERLRDTPEWRFVEREVDIRLSRS